MNVIKVLKMSSGQVQCSCCSGTGKYDEGHGVEECSACSGTGYE